MMWVDSCRWRREGRAKRSEGGRGGEKEAKMSENLFCKGFARINIDMEDSVLPLPDPNPVAGYEDRPMPAHIDLPLVLQYDNSALA